MTARNPLDDMPKRPPVKRVEVRTPVVCQNGHTAYWLFVIEGLDVRELAPTNACGCPKHNRLEGWRASGEPVVTLDRRA